MTTKPVANHPCDECGQLDDHPMVHISDGNWEKDSHTIVRQPSFHFDCLPDQFVSQLGDDPRHEVTRAAIEKAKSGVHGARLRTFIQEHPTDNLLDEEEAKS